MTNRFLAIAALLLPALASPQAPSTKSSPEPKRLTIAANVDGVYSPDGSWIAFASSRDSNDTDALDIYRMDAQGHNVQRLTSDAANDEMPAISPDGRRIAFMSARTGDPEIHLMSADGKNVQRLTRDPGWDIHPRWSPDGRRVLFNSTRDSSNKDKPEVFELYEVGVDGSGLRRLTSDKVISTYASWSPDGAKVVFRRVQQGNSDVFVMNADGSAQTNLTNHAASDGWPIWSADGQRIAFASNRGGKENVFEIYVMKPDGGAIAQVTSLGFRSTAPEFTRDGHSILFSRSGGGFADLYRVALTPVRTDLPVKR